VPRGRMQSQSRGLSRWCFAVCFRRFLRRLPWLIPIRSDILMRHATAGSGLPALRDVLIILLAVPGLLCGLDPDEQLTQYTHATWTLAQGLPQDTIRSITQTDDGYLWIGTNEGLARFDGYDFVTYTRDNGSLPNQRVSKLWAGRNGKLWIGTMGGLVCYSGGKFKTYTAEDGLAPGKIESLIEDHRGALWVVSGENLSYLNGDKFVVWPKGTLPADHPQLAYEDPDQQLWIVSAGGLLKRTGAGFSVVLGPEKLRGNTVTSLLKDSTGLWIGGTTGILLLRPDGSLRRYTIRDGLPQDFVRVLLKDRSGSLWAGTYGGLSRFEHGRFAAAERRDKEDSDWIWCLFEDREGNLWIGSNSSLTRLSDSRFRMYGFAEGLPSDGSNVVHADRRGQVWVGYHTDGLVALTPGKHRVFTTTDGLPSNEIFSIRNARNGDLLIATRNGLSRMRGNHFLPYSVPDPVGRKAVFSALEDDSGNLLAANASGVYTFNGRAWRPVVVTHSNTNDFTVTLEQGKDGMLWAGTLGSGLEQLQETSAGPALVRTFTAGDGLGSNEIRSLYADPDRTLWIGTLGGGLAEFRNNRFYRYTAHDGLLSDSVSHIEDDGRGSLWLSTTKGICRISKQQLRDFSAGKVRFLKPENFGIADGLRSTQCAPGAPGGSGATRTPDGHLWFPTSGGVASINPGSSTLATSANIPPPVRIVEVSADGHDIDLTGPARIKPGTRTIQFHYTGIHLNAPERIQYSYKFDGLDSDWIPTGSRRVIDYGSPPHGQYRLLVRAALPDGESSETQFAIEVLPYFFEARWFLWFCGISLLGMVYGGYRLRMNRVHARFALVTAERARLAREIHDTLAQGLVGISGQLNAVAMNFNAHPTEAWRRLDLARRMAQHSLTEAKRSVLDLRSSELENKDLPAALTMAARRCAAGNAVQILTEIAEVSEKLTVDLKQNLLRIVQEAVTNAVKHASATTIQINLAGEGQFLYLRVKDDGRGFEPSLALSAPDGHFGIVGMRERAERLGGRFALTSYPGMGTELEVKIPFCQVKPTY
jgi:ligand-binding sensor domain-containing protein/two-component sensor histidine kinase